MFSGAVARWPGRVIVVFSKGEKLLETPRLVYTFFHTVLILLTFVSYENTSDGTSVEK